MGRHCALRHHPDNIAPFVMCRFGLCNSRLPSNTPRKLMKREKAFTNNNTTVGRDEPSWTLSGSVTTPWGLPHGSAHRRRLACGAAALRFGGPQFCSWRVSSWRYCRRSRFGCSGCQGCGCLTPVPGPPVITNIDVVKTETGDLFPRSKGSSVQPCKVSNWPGAHPYFGTMTAPTPCSLTSLTPGRPVGTGFISMSLA